DRPGYSSRAGRSAWPPSGGFRRLAAVEAFALRGHVAQQLRRREAGAVARLQPLADLDRAGGAHDVEPAEGAARPRAVAPAEDGADVAFADVFQHALLQRADGLQRLDQQQAVLDLGQVGLVVGNRPEGFKTVPQALAIALFVIGVEACLGLAAEPALVGHGEQNRVDRTVGI